MGIFRARGDDNDALWNAAKKLDDVRIRSLLLKDPTSPMLNVHHPVKGTTPLMVACSKKGRKTNHSNALVVQHLLEFGADMDLVDQTDQRNTALHYAAYANAALAIEHLLHAGANAFALNHKGHTPLDVARLRGRKQAVAVLTQYLSLKSGWLHMNSSSLLPMWKRRWVVVLACNLERTQFEVCVLPSPDDLLPDQVLLIDEASHAQLAPPDAVYSWMEKPNMFQLDRPIVVQTMRDRRFSRDPVTGVTHGHGAVQIKSFVFAAESEASRHAWMVLLGRATATSSSVPPFAHAGAPIHAPTPLDPEPRRSSFSPYPAPQQYLGSPTTVVPAVVSMPFAAARSPPPSAPSFPSEDDAFYRSPGSYVSVLPATPIVGSTTSQGCTSSSTAVIAFGENISPNHQQLDASAQSTPRLSAKRGGSECVVCMDAERDAICVPCGHIAGCHACLTTIKRQDPYKASCPICRVFVQSVVKIYDC